jgi:hypothetical protein
MLRISGLASLLTVTLGVTTAVATDHPIAATKLVLKRTTTGHEKLAFVSKDPTFLFPTLGSANDPSTGSSSGLLLELFAPSSPSGVPLSAPPGSGVPGWTAYPSVPARLSFRNGGAPDTFSSFRSITLRQGKTIKITGKLAGLPLTAPSGSVAVRITMGALRSCAIFTGAAVVKDVAGSFAAHNAAIADCSNVSLGGATTTTTSSTTTTTVAGVCGDNVVNQPSEQCDGSDVQACLGFSCGPPGYATACMCCGYSGFGVGTQVPCCDPSAFFLPSPNGGTCVTVQCTGPFPCTIGACGPAGQCCAPLGGTCVYPSPIPPGVFVFPCCPGLQCSGSGVGSTCCVSNGGSCANNTDCCSGTCDSGTQTCTP